MPPPFPGSGSGEFDDDFDPDLDEFRAPLPPEDRLWRHPSELAGAVPRSNVRSPEALAAANQITGGTSPWGVAIVAGLIGATLSLGIAASFGSFDGDQPVASAPILSMTSVAAGSAVSADGVAELAALVRPALARLETGGIGGAAVAVRNDGYYVTSAQLVADHGETLQLTTSDGDRRPARLVGSDPATDIAVLHVDGVALKPAVIGSADDLQVGAFAVSAGVSTDGGLDLSVTTGIVSAKGRRFHHPNGTTLYDMLLLDAPALEGTAGGALVDRTGAVVGITTGVAAETGPYARLTAAVPIDMAMYVAGHLIDAGKMEHPWAGVEGVDAPRSIRVGAEVRSVVEAGPAALAGVLPGDVIIAIDDAPVESMADLIGALRWKRPGSSVSLRLWRAGEELALAIVLGTRPALP